MSATRRSGFTLLELVISLALLAIVLLSAGQITDSGRHAYEESARRTQAETKARRAVDRLVVELSSLGRTTLFPNPVSAFGTDVLNFQESVGVAGGVIVWSSPLRIQREYAANEPNDGNDDDHDGLIDEGVLVLTRDFGMASALRIVLCTDVPEFLEGETANGIDDNGNGVIDESGFNLRRVGDVIEVRLSVAEPGLGGRHVIKTVETSFRLRN